MRGLLMLHRCLFCIVHIHTNGLLRIYSNPERHVQVLIRNLKQRTWHAREPTGITPYTRYILIKGTPTQVHPLQGATRRDDRRSNITHSNVAAV